MLYVLLLAVGLWLILHSVLPWLFVQLIRGTSWRDWPEESRESATFYGLCIWGGIVASAVFHGLTGRFAEGWEGVACSVLVWIWINRVTMPFLAETQFWLPWSPRQEGDDCGHQVTS